MKRNECRLSVILLAAGDSRRFNGNKMLSLIDGIPMYRHILGRIMGIPAYKRVIVTQYQEIIDYVREQAAENMITPVRNEHSEWGISYSLKLGILSCDGEEDQERPGAVQAEPDTGKLPEQAYLFAVCDQPWLTAESILKLVDAFYRSEKGIVCLSYGGKSGNPVIFHERYRKELLGLEGDTGGKAVMKKHMDDVELVEAGDAMELFDIDRR